MGEFMALEQEVLKWIDEIWAHEEPYTNENNLRRICNDHDLWRETDHALHPNMLETVKRLRERWTDEELTEHAKEVFFISPLYLRYQDEPYWKACIIQQVAWGWTIDHHPAEQLASLVEQAIIANKKFYDNYDDPRSNNVSARNIYYKYLSILDDAPTSPELIIFIKNLLTDGKYLENPSTTSDFVYRTGRIKPPIHFVSRLYEADELDYSLFVDIIQTQTSFIRTFTSFIRNPVSDSDWEKRRALRQMSRTILEFIKPFLKRWQEDVWNAGDERQLGLLQSSRMLTESVWLLRAAELHEKHKLKVLKKVFKGAHFRLRPGLDALVVHMAQTLLDDIQTEDERKDLVEKLSVYPTQTLKYLLPVASHSQDIFLEILEWDSRKALIEIMVEVSQQNFSDTQYSSSKDIPNCGDPQSGTFDVERLKQTTEALNDKQLKEVFKLFKGAQVDMSRVITFIQSFLGWNNEKILKSVGKRQQYAIKAYGLIPLEREEDVLERYLFLKQFAKESKKFGPERQANERAAATAALNNLAQIAGYRDRARLEWAMEALVSEEVAPIGRVWEVDDYTVQLSMEGDAVSLAISKAGKALKSVPKVVRQHADYQEMKDAKAQIQEQYRRLRAVFEESMSLGDTFTVADLENLNRMPTAKALLSKLILYADEQSMGLYLPDEMAIRTLSGMQVSIRSSAIIAHSYHLFQWEELAQWQRYIVHNRIVQPFKQAFRELYLLTPAEEETNTYSNRFAGHVVNGAVAGRLLQARHWKIVKAGDLPVPKKYFREQGIEVRFKFYDVGHYFSEMNPTSDAISFHRYPHTDRFYQKSDNMLSLKDIPPLIFSEVMRDADLIVSVAQRDDRVLMSYESYLRRSEIITALLEDLTLEGVRIEGHFAYVQGKLAKYRVHLGSAVIHIDPGNYLCIVPDRWGKKHKQLFLPFADDKDSKLSEVISKIFFLLADNKIKDESILAQIKGYSR